MDNSKGKIAGITATVIYLLFWVVLMIFWNLKLAEKHEDMGILINFGNSETGMGEFDTRPVEEIVHQADPLTSSPSDRQIEEEILTQEHEEAPAIVQPKPKPTPTKPKTNTETAKPKPNTNPTPDPPKREVNRRALFTGATAGSESSSEGVAGGEGNQGHLAGSPDGSHSGTGTGNSGSSFNLSGRGLIGSLPRPDYTAKEEGRVVVEITVDRQGSVTKAAYRSVGSTTQNATLVNAAIVAAKKAKFNVDEKAAMSQMGTITYIFRMN